MKIIQIQGVPRMTLTQSLVQLQINKNEEEQTNEIKMWNNQCGQKGYTTKHSNQKTILVFEPSTTTKIES